MTHIDAFQNETDIINQFGEGNAYLLWVASMYLDFPDVIQLGSESLTDGSDDKKIDLIRLDRDSNKIVFAQGYFSSKSNDRAPANKASDLNTAAAWLLSGNLEGIPSPLKEIIEECRLSIENGEIEQIDLLYIHNLPESVNVSKELTTAKDHLSRGLPATKNIKVVYKELGIENIERLYTEIESSIIVKDRIPCPADIQFTESGPKWKANILTVPGDWLRTQYQTHGDYLFSANYRGFLGVSKRKKINSGIRSTAEKLPENFWVYNNGITILTNKLETTPQGEIFLHGISIINGAQTTGSIGSLESKISLENVSVPARIIECSDHDTIEEIVKYNNTQNKITTWDKFSNSAEQRRIAKEFQDLGHHYSLKRGFSAASQIGIENVIQPSIALEGHFAESNGGKNRVFESDKMYRIAFEEKKARHILFAFTVSRAIDELRNELKQKKTSGTILPNEDVQLRLLRNLRFKYFLISVFGQSLSVMIGKVVDLSQVGLNNDYGMAANKSINDIVAELLPAVKYVLTFTASVMAGDFSELVRQEDILTRVSAQVESMIHATNSTMMPNPVLDRLKQMLW
jgi:hypothetical protein